MKQLFSEMKVQSVIYSKDYLTVTLPVSPSTIPAGSVEPRALFLLKLHMKGLCLNTGWLYITKTEENEFKLQFPVHTSGGDRFQNVTSGLSGYHQNVYNWISGVSLETFFQFGVVSGPRWAISSVEPAWSMTVNIFGIRDRLSFKVTEPKWKVNALQLYCANDWKWAIFENGLPNRALPAEFCN